MHAEERERLILRLLEDRGFVGFQELDQKIDASPATLRRDLERLAEAGALVRVRGGAKLAAPTEEQLHLSGDSFDENMARNLDKKAAIGRAAAALCAKGDTIIIDGGSTTLQMCPHLNGLGLHVITPSLHIVGALLPQQATRISMPGGTVFREQNIVLSAFDDDGANRFRASKMFMGAASVGPDGLMQNDILLIQSERRLLSRADKLIVLVDSSKFKAPGGHQVCRLAEVATIVTDSDIPDGTARMLEQAGVELVIANAAADFRPRAQRLRPAAR